MGDLLIKHGIIVTSEGQKKSDILIKNGKIAAIEAWDTLDAGNAEIVNAENLHVFPGLVEPHMHIKAPLGGITDILDFDSAGKCAAFGGVTTFMDFSSTLPGDSLKVAVANRLEEMEEKSVLDYSVHCKIVNLVKKESLAELMQKEVDLDHAKASGAGVEEAMAALTAVQQDVDKQVQERLAEIPQMVKDGVPTFKLFMTYRKANVMIDDVYMLQVLRAVKEAGGRCGFHAECNAIAEYNEALFHEENTLNWSDFPRSKPAICEEEAVRRVLYYAELLDAPVFFFHISTKGAVEAIREAKKRGVDVIAETCAHYLCLTQDENDDKNNGILYMMSPPLRSQEDQDALWSGLADNTLSLVTSDNCTFPRWMKEKDLDRENGQIIPDFSKVISGVSGIEERLGLMLSQVGKKTQITNDAGVQEEYTFTLEKMVEILSTNPAKVFGCYPQKGCLAVGSDADIAIIDLKDSGYNLTLDNLHYPVYGEDGVGEAGLEYAVYGNKCAGGRVVDTIRRGEFLVKNGVFQGEQGLPATSKGMKIFREVHYGF